MIPEENKKEAQRIINDTIRMIDEYEAKIDQINKASKRRDRIMKFFFALILLLILITGVLLA